MLITKLRRSEREAIAYRLSFQLALQEYGLLQMPWEQIHALSLADLKRIAHHAASIGPDTLYDDILKQVNVSGQDIPYHPAWYKAFPARLIAVPLFDSIETLWEEVERYERKYPSFFDSAWDGLQVIYELLVDILVERRQRYRQEHLRPRNEIDHFSSLEAILTLLVLIGVEISSKQFPPELTQRRQLLLPEHGSTPQASAPLEWAGSKTDLVELAYALIESGALKAPEGRAKTIARLGAVFGLEITKPEGLLQNIKRREEGARTPFLDKKKEALVNLLRRLT